MRKNKDKKSQQQQHDDDDDDDDDDEDIEEGSGRRLLLWCCCCNNSRYRRCWEIMMMMMMMSRSRREAMSLKCFLYLLLGFAALLFVLLWIKPFLLFRSGFEAKHNLKISSSVHAYFRLQKPVSLLVPYIPVLEYDIHQEIGVPYTKMAVLSMHQLPNAPNWTGVVFGVLSDPVNVPINPVSLSVLKLSLIELLLQQTNLTLTTSIFGRPYDFQILKCPGGITINPEPFALIWKIQGSLFNFTLHQTMSNILDDFTQFKDQLETGLHLKLGEAVNVQITSDVGSTINPPVTVQASIVSDRGWLVPQRLKQLAKSISDSPAKNLGLNNSLFGRVRNISLSTFLNGAVHPVQPSPSPASSPEPSASSGPSISPTSSVPPSHFPVLSPGSLRLRPCPSVEAYSPSDYRQPLPPRHENWQHDLPPPFVNSLVPSGADPHPPQHLPPGSSSSSHASSARNLGH